VPSNGLGSCYCRVNKAQSHLAFTGPMLETSSWHGNGSAPHLHAIAVHHLVDVMQSHDVVVHIPPDLKGSQGQAETHAGGSRLQLEMEGSCRPGYFQAWPEEAKNTTSWDRTVAARVQRVRGEPALLLARRTSRATPPVVRAVGAHRVELPGRKSRRSKRLSCR